MKSIVDKAITRKDLTVQYFRHTGTEALLVVRGKLAAYYPLANTEICTKIEQKRVGKPRNKCHWQLLTTAHLLEVSHEQPIRILYLIPNADDQVTDVTDLHTGPFRLHGQQYSSLVALAYAISSSDEPHHGRLTTQQGRPALFLFKKGMAATEIAQWERVELELGGQPLDSYAYHAGRRVTAAQGAGYGTVTLWQEAAGERRYYVETDFGHGVVPVLPRLELRTVEQLREWYDFRFTSEISSP